MLCGIQLTKLAVVGSPSEDFVVGPARGSGLAGSDTPNDLASNRPCHSPRGELDGFFCATAGCCFHDVTKLGEAIQTPAMDLTVLGQDEGMVLTHGHGFYSEVETR